MRNNSLSCWYTFCFIMNPLIWIKRVSQRAALQRASLFFWQNHWDKDISSVSVIWRYEVYMRREYNALRETRACFTSSYTLSYKVLHISFSAIYHPLSSSVPSVLAVITVCSIINNLYASSECTLHPPPLPISNTHTFDLYCAAVRSRSLTTSPESLASSSVIASYLWAFISAYSSKSAKVWLCLCMCHVWEKDGWWYWMCSVNVFDSNGLYVSI